MYPRSDSTGHWLAHGIPDLRVELPKPGSTGARQRTGVRWAGRYEVRLVIDGWLRTRGEFDSTWSEPVLASTGEWHPDRRRRIVEA